MGVQDVCIHLPQGWIHGHARAMACPFLTVYSQVSPLKPPGLEQSSLKVPPLPMDLESLGTKILLHLIPRSLPNTARRQHCRKPS